MNETCDRCGASAYVRLRQIIGDEPLGRELTLCAHHMHEHGPALVGKFMLVEDHRAELLEPA